MFDGVSGRMPDLFGKKRRTSSDNQQPVRSQLQKKSENIKTWWRQKLHKTNFDDDSSSSNTTLDWRSLSPDRPPLPFFLPSNESTNDTHQTTLIPQVPIESQPRYNNKSRSAEDRNLPTLLPIIEESETMITESTSSIGMKTQSRDNSDEEVNRIGGSGIVEPQPNNRPESNSSSSAISSSRSVSSSDASFHPPPNVWKPAPATKPSTTSPVEHYIPPNTVGDEERCKRKFAKILRAACRYRQHQVRPSEMVLVFDGQQNIEIMRLVREGKTEHHKFDGISQYIPPELSISSEYSSDMVDIWVLGVHLYRMLIGSFPFVAENDQQMFKKMIHSNFTLPTNLSEDAKDLLRRMLAPDATRASLDLVIYHPWIKPYRSYLLEIYQKPKPTKTITPESHKKDDKKKKENFIKKAFLLIIKGPFPPPTHPYRDLAHLGTRESVFLAAQRC